MADLNGVVNQNLLSLLEQDPALQQRLFGVAKTAIEDQAGNQARQINENAFGRGLGLSSVNAQAQALNQAERDKAIAKAGIDSETAARQAILSALGAAAGQQQMQQQAHMQNKQMRSQENIAQNNLIGSGLGAVGGAGLYLGGKAFGPDLVKGIRGIAGLDSGKPGAPGTGSYVGGDAGTGGAAPLSLNSGAAPINYSMPSLGGGLDALSASPDMSFNGPATQLPDWSSAINMPLDALDGLDFSNVINNANWDWSF